MTRSGCNNRTSTFVAVKTMITLLLFLTLSISSASVAVADVHYAVEQVDRPWDVQLFPNPNSGRFQVRLSGSVTKVEMAVFNVIGERVFSTSMVAISGSDIDLSNLAKGLYVVQFRNTDNGKAITRRLFLE